MRAHGLQPRAYRELPDVRCRRRPAAHAAIPGTLSGPPCHEFHGRGRSHNRRIAEGRHASARVHESVDRRVSGRLPRAWARRCRGTAACHRPGKPRFDGAARPDAREEWSHLRERRLGLLQDLHASAVRPARPARPRRSEGRRSRRLGQLRQGQRARLRVVESDEAQRGPQIETELGLRLRPRPARLASRVLGDGPAPARRAAHRHPLRRRRSHLPASRERDRAERRGDEQTVRALLDARRAPADRRREDVEVARQRLQPSRHRREGLSAVGAAVSAALDALPQAGEVQLGRDESGRGVAAPSRRFCRIGSIA